MRLNLPLLAIAVSSSGVVLQVTCAEPHLRKLDARLLRCEAALLDAQHALLTAAANAESVGLPSSSSSRSDRDLSEQQLRVLAQNRTLLLSAASRAKATAAEARAEADYTERHPSPLTDLVPMGLFSSRSWWWPAAMAESHPESKAVAALSASMR